MGHECESWRFDRDTDLQSLVDRGGSSDSVFCCRGFDDDDWVAEFLFFGGSTGRCKIGKEKVTEDRVHASFENARNYCFQFKFLLYKAYMPRNLLLVSNLLARISRVR